MEGKGVICSVGDLMLSDSPLYVSVGVGAAYPKIKGQIFHDCLKEFESADIVIGNLESVVHCPKCNSLSELQMSSNEQMMEEVREAGFNLLNIANNHCLQHGTDGFFKTKSVCEKLGMQCIGIKDELPCQTEVNGIRFVFLSICLYTEFYQPDDICYENDCNRIIQKVKELKSSDRESVVVLAVHWGDEFATYPSNTQIELAHLFVDCGVDIILGHHSHVYQGIEEYKNSLILYGQGNFVSDMIPEMCRKTCIARIIVQIKNEKRTISYEVIPYFINDSFIPEHSGGSWFEDRQRELEHAINGKIPDEDYMKMVSINHKYCHKVFRDRFIRRFFGYKLNISLEMLYAFVARKIQKKMGIYPKRYNLDKTLLLVRKNTSVRESGLWREENDSIYGQ